MRITESVLSYRRSRILLIATVIIAAIAILDRQVAVAHSISLGFLYFFPIFLIASCFGQWQISVVAAIFAVLRGAFWPFDPAFVLPRLFLPFRFFTPAGLVVVGVFANF